MYVQNIHLLFNIGWKITRDLNVHEHSQTHTLNL